jgi:hypothetical protein
MKSRRLILHINFKSLNFWRKWYSVDGINWIQKVEFLDYQVQKTASQIWRKKNSYQLHIILNAGHLFCPSSVVWKQFQSFLPALVFFSVCVNKFFPRCNMHKIHYVARWQVIIQSCVVLTATIYQTNSILFSKKVQQQGSY